MSLYETSMNKFVFPALLGLINISAAAQQSLDEAIAVDGRYAAEVIRMERIAAFPEEYPLTVTREKLPYDFSPLSASFLPSANPMPLPVMNRTLHRGYLDAAVGSRLDAVINAGAWILPPETQSPWTLGAWLTHRSTSLGHYRPDDSSVRNLRYDYDEALGLQGGRRLANGQKIDTRLTYGVRYFDYFMSPEAPSQTINRVKGSVEWTSSPASSLAHSLALEVSHFGWREMFFPGLDPDLQIWKPARETSVKLSGMIEGKVSPGARFSLLANALGLFGATGGNYGLFSFTPTYKTAWRGVHLNAGLRVDLSAKAGSEADPFSAIHLAPAVDLWYPTDHFTFYMRAIGGAEAQTAEARYTVSRWVSPFIASHTPVYSPIDATIGFNGGPAEGAMRGLEGGLQLRWKAVDHLPLYGWYPMAMATGGMMGAELLAVNQSTVALHGLEISGNLRWSYNDIAAVDLSLAYSPQHNSKGFFNGIDRARWVGKGTLKISPVKPLAIRIGADWRGVRYVYGLSDFSSDMEGYRLPDWFSLNVEADWTLSDSMVIGAGIYDLTARSNMELPGVKAEGIAVAARLSWLF